MLFYLCQIQFKLTQAALAEIAPELQLSSSKQAEIDTQTASLTEQVYEYSHLLDMLMEDHAVLKTMVCAYCVSNLSTRMSNNQRLNGPDLFSWNVLLRPVLVVILRWQSTRSAGPCQ